MDYRTADRLLDHALAHHDALFFVVGPDRHIQFIRPLTATCQGRSTHTFLGADLLELFPGVLDGLTAINLHHLLDSHADGVIEVFEPAAGRWYAIHFYPHDDLLTCLAFDVTTHKQADLTLRRTNSSLFNAQRAQEDAIIRLRLAITAGGIGTWDFDCATNQLTWDDGMYALFGLEPPSNLDVPIPFAWDTYIHRDDRNFVALEVNAWIAGRNPGVCAHRIVQPGGAVRWLNTSARLIQDADGQVAHIIGLCVDVTAEHHEIDRWRPSPTR